MLQFMQNLVPKVNNVQSILYQMQAMQSTFYLTGSRYFGNFNKDSDWDFFTQDNPGVIDSLKSLGFTEISSDATTDTRYDREQFKTILEFNAVDGDVQIQFIKNVFSKIYVQNHIFKEYKTEFNSMDKIARSKLWALLLIIKGHNTV